jgi:hypothetical protein
MTLSRREELLLLAIDRFFDKGHLTREGKLLLDLLMDACDARTDSFIVYSKDGKVDLTETAIRAAKREVFTKIVKQLTPNQYKSVFDTLNRS